jgi:glutathione S-transferase
MELYFSPMACSLASRIALYEAGAKDAQFVEVDPKTKRTPDGANYFDIYPLGLVPLLRLDDGSFLSENAAILQYVAGRYPQAQLAPKDDIERARTCSNGCASSARNCTRGSSSRCSIKRRRREPGSTP